MTASPVLNVRPASDAALEDRVAKLDTSVVHHRVAELLVILVQAMTGLLEHRLGVAVELDRVCASRPSQP